MVELQHYDINHQCKVYRVVSDLFNSNTYIVLINNKVIIVDPAENEKKDLLTWLEQSENTPDYCWITHEHFDHHAGFKHLNNQYNFLTYCSPITKEAMKDSKKNLSFYYQLNVEGVIEEQDFNITKQELSFEMINCPGHSKGSVCFLINNCLFGGDTIIQKEYLVTKLPGGNRKLLNESIEVIKSKIEKYSKNIKVFPGHGEPFWFNEWDTINNFNE